MDKKLKSAEKRSISYAKWGYIFIIPFFVVYAIFTLYPQILTIYNSFFEYYRDHRSGSQHYRKVYYKLRYFHFFFLL